MKPNFVVILIDDLRYDEFGAGGHPYMKTPHVDRLAELYDLERDPWELKNLARGARHAAVRARLRRELRKLVADAAGL